MKRGRSNQFTTGLCNTFENCKDLKTLFFEVDHYDPRTESITPIEVYNQEIKQVIALFAKYKLDLLVHSTKNGMHFLSPTMLPKSVWKQAIDEIRHINTKCPMNTLRIEPNKYPNENEFWYRFNAVYIHGNFTRNNFNMCNYLNKIFGCHFVGSQDNNQKLKIVRYPLPESR